MIILRATLFVVATAVALAGADAPQFGAAWSRNMVSPERGLPTDFEPATGRNIKWVAKLGNETHSTPVVANGRVYIGTNNREPRDPRHQGDRGVLMCFDEKTGKFLWQLVVPKREEDRFHDWPNAGISSPATVEGDRVYIVSSRGELMCLDAQGMANGNDGPFTNEVAQMIPKPGPFEAMTPAEIEEMRKSFREPGALDADIIWSFDLTTGAGIWSHDAAHSSVLIFGDHIYLNSGTGVDNTHKKIRTPDAPSLVVFDKRTGEYLARDDERIAPDIFHCTWSAPSLGSVGGKPVIFFCGGNGIVYGFEPLPPGNAARTKSDRPAKLKKVFEFDPDPNAPKSEVHRYNTNRREGPSNIYGMPVVVDGRLYVAGGGDIFWGKNEAWLQCIDASRFTTTRQTNAIWNYTLDKHVLSTPAVFGDMVFIADCGRKMHCVDRASGRSLWTHDIKGEVWASPYVADGKVYLGTRSGAFYVFAASREKTLLFEHDFKVPISATTTAANGTLYIATMSQLYAIELKR